MNKFCNFWSRWGGFITLAIIYILACSLETCSYV